MFWVTEPISLLKTYVNSTNWWKWTCCKRSSYEKKRQKELEKLGYYLVRVNADKPGFDDYEEFGRVSAYFAKSIKNQTKNH